MKLNKENKQFVTISNLLIVTCLSILFFFLIKNINLIKQWIGNFIGIINPFIIGFVIAYLLNRPMQAIENLLEKYLYKGKLKQGIKRTISIILIFLIAGFAIYLVGSFVLPQLVQSLSILAKNIPIYINSLRQTVTNLITQYNLSEELLNTITKFFSSWDTISEKVANWIAEFVPYLVNVSVNITSKVFNVILSIVVSIYALSGKEKLLRQFKKLMVAIFPNNFNKWFYEVAHIINDTFGQYISGQMLDAVIVGTLCAILMFIFKFPFALLVGVIVCVTNVIPMIGPFIGAVPSTFIILMVDPIKAIWFISLIFILQQIDGNILVPRIVGDSTGLSGLWVLFAIVVGGGLFGILGVLLCVPTLSVIFKLLKIFVDNRLAQKSIDKF